jgi:RND family efflux transporter MFP subunit
LPAIDVQTVKVSMIYRSRALTTLNASGYVVAQRKAAVSSKATGRLEKLYVEEGKRVKAGEVIGVLENDDLRATLTEARAALSVAQAALRNAQAELHDATLNFNRNKSLREAGAVSEQAFDTAEARYKKAVASETSARFGVDRAEASIKVAEVNLEYSYIRAPFEGVILTKNADVGEVVAPFGASVNSKAAVVTMADMDSLMVEVDVAESSLEKVKVGAAAEIKLDAYPEIHFPGTVHMIVPTADRTKATVMTKVKFNRLDPRVLPEMSAKVAFLSRPLAEDEHKPFLGIPAAAISKSDDQHIVFRINDMLAKATKVKIGRRWNDTVEILAGLTEGDIVALNSSKDLKNGRRVNVKE